LPVLAPPPLGVVLPQADSSPGTLSPAAATPARLMNVRRSVFTL
jgi:hypothetical protein